MLTEYEKQRTGEWYNPDDREIKKLQDISRAFMRKFNFETDGQKRFEILKKWLKSTGKSYIEPPVFIDFGCHVTLGDNVYFNTGCTLLDSGEITIGDNTMIGSNVQFLTPEHPQDPDERIKRAQKGDMEKARAITIGKNCWIASGAMILAGVTIGDGTTIGAGSVVTRDVPPRSLAVGNPARVIKSF